MKPNSVLNIFQGLNLLELASHLERKAAQLRCEGLGRIKMALKGTDTSSLIEILDGFFGHVELDTTTSSISTDTPAQKPPTTEMSPEEPLEKAPAASSEESSLASAKLVIPLKSIPLMIAGLPESLLPMCGPETFSSYRCQYPSCNQKFSQKAGACNHIHHDHLNVTLACLSCSFDNTPKLHWYSVSTWEHHTQKHTQDNLPIHPDEPAFFQQFAKVGATPSTSKLTPDLSQANAYAKGPKWPDN